MFDLIQLALNNDWEETTVAAVVTLGVLWGMWRAGKRVWTAASPFLAKFGQNPVQGTFNCLAAVLFTIGLGVFGHGLNGQINNADPGVRDTKLWNMAGGPYPQADSVKVVLSYAEKRDEANRTYDRPQEKSSPDITFMCIGGAIVVVGTVMFIRNNS